MKVYGSHLCEDTQKALKELKDVDFRNISEDLSALKEFLAIRDNNPLYDEVKKNGGIGIPVFVLDDGTVTFDY